MFRESCISSFVAFLTLVGVNLAIAEEPKDAGEKQTANSIGMKLTLVPSGEFTMGSAQSADETVAYLKKNYGMRFLGAEALQGEHPQHRVRITKPFYLGTYHVTRGQFRQFIIDSGYKTDAEKGEKPGAVGWDAKMKMILSNETFSWRNTGFEQTDDHPVVNVSWNDAAAFCQWLSRKEGKAYRLPTETEWEYVCRAGTKTRYYSGDDPETLAKVGNVADLSLKTEWSKTKFVLPPNAIRASDGYVFTAPIGRFKPNAFGLYDMHGNAYEWCGDRYSAAYYSASPADDPAGPESGSNRVLRGSSWDSGPDFARSAARNDSLPDFRSLTTGFRVVRNLKSGHD